MDLKDALRGKLDGSEICMVKKSFDIIGDIAVMELDAGLKKRCTCT